MRLARSRTRAEGRLLGTDREGRLFERRRCRRDARPLALDGGVRTLAEAQDGLLLGGKDPEQVVEAQDLEDVLDGFVELGERGRRRSRGSPRSVPIMALGPAWRCRPSRTVHYQLEAPCCSDLCSSVSKRRTVWALMNPWDRPGDVLHGAGLDRQLVIKAATIPRSSTFSRSRRAGHHVLPDLAHEGRRVLELPLLPQRFVELQRKERP